MKKDVSRAIVLVGASAALVLGVLLIIKQHYDDIRMWIRSIK